MANLDTNAMMFRADRDTWNKPIKTIKGNAVRLVATRIPRNPRKYKTVNIYHIQGTNLIVFNRSRDGVYFMRIAIRPENVRRFYDTFVRQPLTPKEKQWLDLYDYKLV